MKSDININNKELIIICIYMSVFRQNRCAADPLFVSVENNMDLF